MRDKSINDLPSAVQIEFPSAPRNSTGARPSAGQECKISVPAHLILDFFDPRKGTRPMARQARSAAGAQTPPLLQPGTDARAQNEDGSGGCGHFAASSPPRKRHRVAKPTSPRAPGTLRRQMTQIWASYVHARVPNGPRNRHGRKNDCQGVSIWSSWGLMVSCASHTPGIGQGIVLNRKHPKPLVSKARMGTIRLKCHAFERKKMSQ